MASRRSNPRDSDRVRTQTGFNPKDLEDEKSVARVKSSSPTGSEGRDRPPKKAKTNGSDYRLGVLGEAGVAKPFHWQFSHSKDCPITEDPDSVAHLVRHFKLAGYVPPSDELYEIKKVVRELKLGLKKAQDRERANTVQLAAAEKLGNQATSLEARLRVVSNERKSALEQVSFMEAKIESFANKFSDDLRRATYDSKKALADSYLDVLEIMNNNLLASDELLRLRTKKVEFGSELDVMAVSDFSVGKLDLPQISEDLPEDFFTRDSSAANGADDVTKCSGCQFEDGEFGIVE
ncbi:hypothetical protein DY000_02022982 [Brassica cretica]|uniref:Uncharacterized protein n=1 Tax=Brassica cretica TaxID=69181 RepID=A0ABQ7E8K8_BRACR|nr:hypothetical protein DY000_02022982 [Brassica cretica]